MTKLGVVVFGASTFDNHRNLNNSRFANSAREFKKAIGNPEIVADCNVQFLDLYDEPLFPGDVLLKITDFVAGDFDDIIIYYCGHGDVSRQANEYRVFLRTSKRDLRHATLLDVVGLIRDVQKIASDKKIFFVLDACFSGSAINQTQEFMDASGAQSLIDRSLSETVSQRGVAVFAATSGVDVALAKKSDKLSLFTGALIRCLSDGIPYKRDLRSLSWQDVRDEIVRSTRDRLGPDAPVPKITSLDERFGDVTRAPFFRNRAYSPTVAPLESPEELFWKSLPSDPSLSILDHFATRFPDGTFVSLAREMASRMLSRLTELELKDYLTANRRTNFKTEINTRLKTIEQVRASTDTRWLRELTVKQPETELALIARARLVALEGDSGARPASLLSILQHHRSAPDGWRRYAALAILLLLVGAISLVYHLGSGRYAWNLETIRRDFDAAGHDLVKLRAFVAQCKAISCPLEQEAVYRLAGVEHNEGVRTTSDRQALDNVAKDNVEALGKFVKECEARSCIVLEDARRRLALAEASAKARTEADRKSLAEIAVGDVPGIDKFVKQCEQSSCAVLPEARNRLKQAVADAKARAEFDRRSLDAIPGNDVDSLGKFVKQCEAASCAVLTEARGRLQQAVTDAKARADSDRKSLDAIARSDIDGLMRFVKQCETSSCAILTEARGRLQQAMADAKARAESDRKSLDAIARSDIDGLTRFAKQCEASSCTVLAEARGRLQQAVADARARAEADRKSLDSIARNDVDGLRGFVRQCQSSSCAILADAKDRLAKAVEAASIVADRAAFDAIGDHLSGLRTYLDRCSVNPCRYEREARDRLDRAEAADVVAAGYDADRLQACVQACGSIAARTEAQNKLSIIRNEDSSYSLARGKVDALQAYLRECRVCRFKPAAQSELATLTAPRPASFNTFVNYDIDGNDVEIVHRTSFDNCTRKCQSNSRCVAYIFDKWKGSCYLKDRVGPLILDPHYNAEIRSDQPRPVNAATNVKMCPYRNSAMIGDAITTRRVESRDVCQRGCESDQSCVAFTFQTVTASCTFLRSVSDRTKNDTNFVSGAKMQNPC